MESIAPLLTNFADLRSLYLLHCPLNPPILGDFRASGYGRSGRAGQIMGILRMLVAHFDMKPDRIRGTTPDLIAAARRLRQNLTPAEQVLWKAISNRQLNGLRFRCQHPIGSFIVDFYCPQCRLIIEVDGEIHDQQIEYDTARTTKLNQFGYRVVRFSNHEVITNLDAVLRQIIAVSQQT